jgi:hypothetical protein
MKICFSEKSSKNHNLTNTGFLEYLSRNHEISDECSSKTDIIFNMSAFNFKMADEIHKKHPKIPLVNYVWDYYKFAHDGKHWFDWKSYADFLKKSDKIIVPSYSQKLRLKELLGLDSVVVKAGHRMFDAEINDKRFVLDNMRWYPEKNERWIVDACDDLCISVIHPDHNFPSELFSKTVASCTFLACGYLEASTGGLTILEGLWLGKPTLLSDSPYQGGKDYLGDWAVYFKHDDFNDCKKKLKEMFYNTPKIDIDKARKYIIDNFSYEVMTNNLEKVFNDVKSSYSN